MTEPETEHENWMREALKMADEAERLARFAREVLVVRAEDDTDILAVAGSLAISGGSAGGELMGAVVNQAPELFGAVAAHVPFVDVLNTMLDGELPLTPIEWPEWGNPIEDVSAFEHIRSYSPYDQVETKEYPNLLVTTGLHDSQVQYWEPAKWVAKLRDMKTDDNQLLMYCNMETGHGGASGRFEAYKETAMEYAFLFSLEGITQ